jgi:hypothetical protein
LEVVVTDIVLFPVPVEDEIVNQSEVNDTFQSVFDVTVKLPAAPDIESVKILAGDTDRAGL